MTPAKKDADWTLTPADLAQRTRLHYPAAVVPAEGQQPTVDPAKAKEALAHLERRDHYYPYSPRAVERDAYCECGTVLDHNRAYDTVLLQLVKR